MCYAWRRCFGRDGAVETRAWEIAEGAGTAAGLAGRIAACCVAEKAATVEEALATCGIEDSHGRDSERLEAFHSSPSRTESCPEAYRCSVGGDASGLAAVECAAETWEKAPYCSEG